MIKNERQYRITKAQLDRFSEALSHAGSDESIVGIDAALKRAELAALRSQYEELRDEILAYEALQAQESQVVEVESFDQLPAALIRARIASGLSQKELANRLKLKEQQIQRYEATNYATASFSRLSEIVNALGVKVREDIFVPRHDLSIPGFISRLETLGVSPSLAKRRLLSSGESRISPEEESSGIAQTVFHAASAMRRIYGWNLAEILGNDKPVHDLAVAGAARFKLPANASDRTLASYTLYAYYLALLALRTTPTVATKPIPRNPAEVSKAIRSSYGELTFRNALEYVWSLGIVVLPLADIGAFHGAFWRIKGRNIIVLKQRTKSEARWLFDLLHELWHAGEEADLAERTILELPENDPERVNANEEKIASRFAGNIVLDGRAEELVQILVKQSGGLIPRFKSLVPEIANRERVSLESFANYVAFRLSLQGENWWGTANNLQVESDPWSVARDLFLIHSSMSGLDDLDTSILTRALQENDEVSI